jgi:dolichol-phosphate mannosyltransferase
MISVVIPTYNEARVIQQTLRRAVRALTLTGEEFELIVVDDAGSDSTAEIAEAMAAEIPVRVLRRPKRLGLGAAVVDGWRISRGDVLGVMDGDCQHPPEVLAALLNALRTSKADIVIASRYMQGGASENWSWARRSTSWLATRLAVCALPWIIADVTDPMSGMFLIRAPALEGVQLHPTGFKILLEVLARARYTQVIEVPYTFDRRNAGSSKLGLRQYIEFLQHVVQLANSSGHLTTWLRYVAAGFITALIYLAVLFVGTTRMTLPWVVAVPAAIQLAVLTNFVFHQKLTFPTSSGGDRPTGTTLSRLLSYERAGVSGDVFNMAVVSALVSISVNHFLAAATGFLVGGFWNCFLNGPAIWQIWRPPIRASAPDIHPAE